MKLSQAFTSLVAFSIIGAVCAQHISDEAVRTSVASFCTALSIPPAGNLQIVRTMSKATQKPRIAAIRDRQLFGIDTKTGNVTHFIDEEVASAIRRGSSGQQPNMNQVSAMVEASRIRRCLTNRGSWHVAECTMGRVGATAGSEWRIRLDEVVNGIATGGNGNTISMILDATTGRLSELTLRLSKEYEPASTSLSAPQAIARANSILSEHDPTLISDSPTATLRYVAPLPGFGNSAFPSEVASQKTFYMYAVRFKRCVVFISAKTGKSHGGIRLPKRNDP